MSIEKGQEILMEPRRLKMRKRCEERRRRDVCYSVEGMEKGDEGKS